jgi:hypothetical protein
VKAKHTSIRRAQVKFKVGQHDQISKEKLKFANGGEENYIVEIFSIHKVVRKIPKPVYEFAVLLGKNIEGHFYAEELSPVIDTKNTVYQIDKILCNRVRNGSVEVFVKWSGYPSEFNSWIPAKSLKKHGLRRST